MPTAQFSYSDEIEAMLQAWMQRQSALPKKAAVIRYFLKTGLERELGDEVAAILDGGVQKDERQLDIED